MYRFAFIAVLAFPDDKDVLANAATHSLRTPSSYTPLGTRLGTLCPLHQSCPFQSELDRLRILSCGCVNASDPKRLKKFFHAFVLEADMAGLINRHDSVS